MLIIFNNCIIVGQYFLLEEKAAIFLAEELTHEGGCNPGIKTSHLKDDNYTLALSCIYSGIV